MTSKAFGLAKLGNAYADGALSNRNKIINGAMTIDQRNAGAAVSVSTSPVYGVDRFYGGKNGTTDNFTMQRVATAPVGFQNSLLITAGNGVTPATNDFVFLSQGIEGFNFSELGWGGAGAQSATLSFWVRSSLTGNFGVGLRNGAANRSYIASYTINAANTWEYKTITIEGDITGTWATDNTQACGVFFDLGNGSSYSSSAGSWESSNLLGGLTGGVKLVATTGATFYLTGVQLEAGDTATPFEHRSYGAELALCQRYTRVIGDGINGVAPSAGAVYFNYTFDQPMRAAPTVTLTDTTVLISDQYFSDHTSTGSAIIGNNQSSIGGRTSINGFSGLTTGRFYSAYGNTNQSFLLLSAEL